MIELLSFVFQGNQKKSIEQLREMISEGIEPSNFLNDLLELVYVMQQKKSIGDFDTELHISESENEIISKISSSIDTSTLIVFWQLILKVLEELPIVSSATLALEMLVVRLIHLKEMPSYENILESIEYLNLKEIWEKLRILKVKLHLNEVSDKRSHCFWCTCHFDNPPIYIPKQERNNIIEVYGCFCSPECAVAYLKNEPIDCSVLWERYALLNNIYSKIYNYKIAVSYH